MYNPDPSACMNDSNAEDGPTSQPIVPRQYQMEMFEAAMKENVIVTMDTGSGKTTVALLRIAAELERCPGSQLVWFTAPTVPLARQQHQIISSQLPAYHSRLISGADKPELWSDQTIWDAVLLNIRIVVSTPAILLDVLTHGFLKISQFSLLVLDEAHHAHDDAPLNRLMQTFYHPKLSSGSADELPYILGLTASPITGNKTKALTQLEANLNAICKSPTRHFEELKMYVHLPKLEYVIAGPSSLPYPKKLKLLGDIVNEYYDTVHNDPYVKSLLKDGDFSKFQKAGKFQSGEKKTDCQKVLATLLRRAEDLHSEIGSWAAEYYVTTCARKYAEAATKPMMIPPSVEDFERQCLANLLSPLVNDDSSQTLLQDEIQVASKGSSLLRLLSRYHDESINGIIFVETRCKVAVLAKLISVHPLTAGRYNVSPLVGSSSFVSKKADLLEMAESSVQNETLENFRSGKTNLIVATSVLEEGIDVKATNLVIRFDEPKNLRSYVQSRGRARKEDSKFVVFLPDAASVSSKWEALEREMKELYMKDRQRIEAQSVIEEQERDNRTYRVTSTDAVLTLDNAVPHLYHFCNKLTKVPYAQDPRPEFIVSGERGISVQTRVILPSSVDPSIRESWSHHLYRSERLSKQDAAFEAYIKLHKSGLVNDHLLPERRVKKVVPSSTLRDGHIRIRPRLDPWLDGVRASPTQWESHGISVTAPGMNIPPMLLLCRRRLSTGFSFSLRWSLEVVLDVSVRPSTSLDVPCVHSEALAATQLLFQSMYRNKLSALNVQWNTVRYPYLFAPERECKSLLSWVQSVTGTIAISQSDNFTEDGMCEVIEMGKVMRRNQGLIRKKDRIETQRPYKFKRSLLKVRTLDTEWTLDTENHLANAIDTVEDLHFELWKMPKRINYVVNEGAEMTPTGFLSEPVQNLRMDLLPLAYGSFMLYVPSILYYMEIALIAQRLSETVLAPLQLDDIDLLINTITAPAANQGRNYERLEFLGDSLLKYSTSHQLFANNPLWPEGYLTEERGSLVGNSRLCKAALEQNLDLYVTTEAFSGSRWKPTFVDDLLKRPEESLETRETSPKLLADVVEALIGAAYINGAKNSTDRDKKLLDCLAIFLPEVAWSGAVENVSVAKSRVPKVHSGAFPEQASLSNELFGYRFDKIVLFLEALTHPSAPPVSDFHRSYQRLEFLGDAILDRVITVSIFEFTSPKYPSGLPQSIMSMLRHGLVSDDLLAFLCLGFSLSEPIAEPIVDAVTKEASTIDKTVEKQLWRFMRHGYGAELANAQQRTWTRYLEMKDQIRKELAAARKFPWVLLAQLRAGKFYADIVEAIIGAIFIDSNGDLGAVTGFLARLGLLDCMEALFEGIRKVGVFDTEQNVGGVEIMHPKARLGIVAARQQRRVNYEVEPMAEGKGLRGVVQVAGEVVGSVDGAFSRLEAETVAAEMGLEVLLKEVGILRA